MTHRQTYPLQIRLILMAASHLLMRPMSPMPAYLPTCSAFSEVKAQRLLCPKLVRYDEASPPVVTRHIVVSTQHTQTATSVIKQEAASTPAVKLHLLWRVNIAGITQTFTSTQLAACCWWTHGDTGTFSFVERLLIPGGGMGRRGGGVSPKGINQADRQQHTRRSRSSWPCKEV